MSFVSTDRSLVFSFTFMSTLSRLLTSSSKQDSVWFV